MASEAEEPVWQPSTDAQALAHLRSLIRSYIRGELSHAQMVLQFGLANLTHDVGTPRPPIESVQCEEEYCGHLEDPAAGEQSSMPLHNPSCGCDWCSQESCMEPAVHDGSGDCGCPSIAED